LLVAIERRDASDDLLGDAHQAISVITVSELLHGVHRADVAHRTRRRLVVERILAVFDALPITEEIARVHAEVGADLAVRGQQITTHDLWIASTALVHDLTLATRNPRDFARVPGLQVIG
jgi:predicted nucleic acid-binding protein